MKSKGQKVDNTADLFRSELKNILNLRHELCLLSKLVNWAALDQTFGDFFPSEVGYPATPTRLVVGLFYLKATFNLSDEALVDRWVENPYWQYFCGEQYLQHTPPINPSSMSRWRKRLKASGAEKLLEETILLGLKTEVIKKKDLKKVIADTTVQEKNITYPTDSKLFKRGIDLIISAAKERQAKSRKTRSIRRAMKRRSAVEPLIGYLKNDGHLRRNFLKGTQGDAFNVVMSGVGYNLRAILKKLRFFLAQIFYWFLGFGGLFSSSEQAPLDSGSLA